jgi:hypothetical protein
MSLLWLDLFLHPTVATVRLRSEDRVFLAVNGACNEKCAADFSLQRMRFETIDDGINALCIRLLTRFETQALGEMHYEGIAFEA